MDLNSDAIAHEMSDCRITHMVYAQSPHGGFPQRSALSGPTCPAIASPRTPYNQRNLRMDAHFSHRPFEMRSNGMHGNTLCSGDVRSPLTLREALHGTPFGVSERTRCSQIRADRLRFKVADFRLMLLPKKESSLGRRILDPVQSAPDITQVVYGTRSSRRNCGTIFDRGPALVHCPGDRHNIDKVAL